MHTSIRSTPLLLAALLAGCAHSVPPITQPKPDQAALDSLAALPKPDMTAPDSFTVAVETTRGPVILALYRAWAPAGVDHFYTLVRERYYDSVGVFRVEPGFVVQFGLAADPAATARYRDRKLPDDTVRTSNVRGTLTFARPAVPNSRTTQLFINLAYNGRLDTADGFGFPPIGRVVKGIEAIDRFTAEYKANPPRQSQIMSKGNAYLVQFYPKLDYIIKMRILKEWNHR
jgi:peptidyl-prolyl cis-trans isomerase A (cyclophilin A)